MTDYDDDWMNPQSSVKWSNEPKEERPFLIQREAAIQCSFVGGRRPTEWKFWMSYATREERDAALKKLRSDHPAWHLRPAFEDRRFGRSDITVEDEEGDLRARLLMLRMRKGSSHAE